MPEHVIDASDRMDRAQFDYVCAQLTDALDEINPHGATYVARGQSVGWQDTSGETTVELQNGLELLRKLTPNGSWNLEARVESDALHLTLSHHDSPTGETHVITAPEGE